MYYVLCIHKHVMDRGMRNFVSMHAPKLGVVGFTIEVAGPHSPALLH